MPIKTEESTGNFIEDDLDKIIQGIHPNPHRVLGLHQESNGNYCVCLWRPSCEEVQLEVRGKIYQAKPIREGIFVFISQQPLTKTDYLVHHPSGILDYDPYAFFPTFTEEDAYSFSRGIHYQIYHALGGRIVVHEGVLGAKFSVWAPNAKQVSLMGDFNNWDPDIFPMRKIPRSGVWEIFIPGLTEMQHYQYAVKTQHDHIRHKSDPYALYMEKRPENKSILFPQKPFQWEDDQWIEKRSREDFRVKPMSVYEVHLGSWKKGKDDFFSYRELAPLLCDYCKELGFTHIEVLPLNEHPLDESWGYQITGFYSVTSRYGTPEDFQYFINYMHKNDIGVFLDWVPAHFPTDDFSLARFDGTYLYEHEDPRKGFHPHWNTLIFNYGRYEVSNFLIGSALFWLDQFHVDGLRVDAVASMLYLDYGRKDGEWIPNKYGGKENLEAIEFLKHLNSSIHSAFPGVITIAEESTAFPGITDPVDWGGLGFDLKWNMGWMNDTLKYFEKDPVFRKYHHHSLHFMFSYAFSEKYMLVLSHDEVVHGKRSLAAKMPGDTWQQFANLRMLLGFMACHPGKNLLFMGGELAQWNEWHCKEEIHWHLLKHEPHQQIQKFVKKLNHFYLKYPALWEFDFDPKGFQWIDYTDADRSIVSFFRRGNKHEMVCIFHFTPVYRSEYFIQIPKLVQLREVFNSDSQEFGGSGKLNEVALLKKNAQGEMGFFIDIAPLAFHIFEVEFE